MLQHVPEQLAAMATLRAAALVECEYCIDIGSAITQERGIDDRKIQNLARWSESDTFNDTERLVLELTDAMTKTPAVAPSDLVRRLIVDWGRRELSSWRRRSAAKTRGPERTVQ